MKKIVIILLALITLLACISCDKSNDTPEQTDDTPPYQEMFLSYDDIIDTLLDMSKNGCLDLYENRSALFSERESKIYSELRNLADTTYGSVCYTIRDVNKDGTDELIFTSADPYHMLNLLTLKDNKPVMLDFFWSGTNNHVGSIDENGVVYKEAYGKGDNYHYYVKEIIAGELVGLEFGVLDRDIDDAEVEYYKDENGTYTVILESEFYEIREQYDHVFSKRYASNYILGLGPYTKLIEASPDYKIIDYGEDDNGNQKIICEFYDKNGGVIYRITPDMLGLFHNAPEAIKGDLLFNMLLADGSIKTPEDAKKDRELEHDPMKGASADGKDLKPVVKETEPEPKQAKGTKTRAETKPEVKPAEDKPAETEPKK